MLKSFYVLPGKVTKEFKFREFQYKVLNFLINTNLLLKKKQLKTTDVCDFCHEAIENMYHLFYGCEHSKKFWEILEKYWKDKTTESVNITLKDVILGNTIFPDLLNYLIILGKHFIFKSKLELMLPLFVIFKYTISMKYEFEKYVSVSEEKFKLRWTFEP